eukprot:jgi/Mesvir1/28523/Mv04265-RA.1
MFAVDRKTAYKYYQWWKQDRENGVDYSNPDHLKKSLLNPLTWKTKNADRAWEVRPHDWLETRFRPRIAGREPADPRELWTRLSKHLADLQTNHLPQYTAADLVIAVEKVASKGREVLPRAEPPLRLQSYYDPDTIEPVYPLDYATHEAAATRTRRAAAEAAAAAEAEADNRAIVPVAATSGALVVPPRSSRAIVRRPDRANDRIIVFPFMKDSRIYGDEISDPTSLAEFAKDFPPGVMFKNVTPLLRGGNDDIKVNGMLKETEEAARASMLTYPETGNADKSHDDEDEKSGSQLMVEKLMQVDYVNRKLRIADGAQKTARLTNLARAIYRALSVHWTIQGMSSSMTPLDVATHIWFIVHHCKGQEHWMDGKLRDMKDPYVYGYPPRSIPISEDTSWRKTC